MIKYGLKEFKGMYFATITSFDNEYDDFIKHCRNRFELEIENKNIENDDIFEELCKYYTNEPSYELILNDLSNKGIEIFSQDLDVQYTLEFMNLIKSRLF